MQTWNDVRSTSLGMATSATIFTPQAMGDPGSRKPGLLILLHGLAGNHATWEVRADLQSLAGKHHLVFALPDGARSFWLDQAVGLRWGTWVGEEFPALVRATLGISKARCDTFIGGLSMGGYGAMRAALDHPETFAGALSLSGTLDVAEAAFRERHPDLYEVGFGHPSHPRPEDDLVARLNGFAGKPPRPVKDLRLFATCGREDRLLKQSRRFHAAARSAGLNLTYQEGPGAHNFRFWNEWLPRALDALVGLPRRGEERRCANGAPPH